MSLGDLIRKAREAKKLSQQSLADKVGVTRAAVGKWESDLSAPTRRRAPKVATVLGIPLKMVTPFAEAHKLDALTPTIDAPLIRMDALLLKKSGEIITDGAGAIAVDARTFGEGVFAVEMSNDELAPAHYDGDVLIAQPGLAPLDGDYVIVSVGRAHCVVRRYVARGKNTKGFDVFDLTSPNPDHATIPVHSDRDVKLIGVFIEQRRMLRKTA